MKEKVQKAVKAVLGLALGVFVGRSLWLRQDVISHPELYAANSAPWYTPLLFLTGGLVWLLTGRKK